jgi:serine protease Do
VEWDGKKVDDFADLRLLVANTAPGETATLKLWRDGNNLTYRVTVERRQKAVMQQRGGWLGLQVQDLTEEMKRRLGEPELHGVLVANVSDESPARRYIEPRDVILSVNRKRITSVEQYREIIARTSAKKGVLIRFLDADTGRMRFVTITG